MAENNKGGILNKAEKILRRRKTKVLQSLGKTGRTTDEQLVEDGHKLERQQEVGNRFQKDLRTYIQSARVLAAASKTFYTTVSETYEAEWEGHKQVDEVLTNMDALWQDYIQKLTDQVQDPLHKYLTQIPSIKARVSKRGRKLIDYDNARHNLEVQQNAKKKDEAKTSKAQEDLDQAKKIYDDLNNELHQELPEFYNSRVTFYGNTFQSLFDAESVFHLESGKVWELAPSCDFTVVDSSLPESRTETWFDPQGTERVAEINKKLTKDNEQFTYTPRKNLRNTMSFGNDEPVPNGHGENGNSGYDESPQPDSPGPLPSTPTPSTPGPSKEEELVVNGTHEADTSKDSIEDSTCDNEELDQSQEERTEETTEVKVETTTEVIVDSSETKAKAADEEPKSEKTDEEPTVNGDVDTTADREVPDYPPPQPPTTEPPSEPKADTPPPENQNDETDGKEPEMMPIDEGLYQVPPPAKPIHDDLPDRYLYTVTATHPYKGEDDDELTFETHEVIYVIAFDDPDDQDPGWLMGIRKQDRQRGVFPENFTKKV